MIRYSQERLCDIRADAVIVETDCLGNPNDALWRQIVRGWPEVASLYQSAFERGDLEPGRVVNFQSQGRAAKQVFFLPTRVHPDGRVREEFVDSGLDQIVHQMLDFGSKSVAFAPMGAATGDVMHPGNARGLQWPDVRRRLLYAFSRVPDIELIGLLPVSSFVRPVTIFTDGGAEPNPGRGGYGVVLRFGSHRKELSGGFQHTSNERMELLAAVEGLQALKQPCRVHLHSDSRYVVDTVNDGLLFRLAARQWKRSKAKNLDLWQRFLEAYIAHDVEMVWVKGHSGIEENERCDQLATEAIKRGTLQPDHGFRSGKRSKRSIKQSKQTHAVSVAQDDISVASSRPSTTATSVIAPSATTTTSATLYRPRKEGDHCQHCQTPMVKRRPKQGSTADASASIWYLFCEGCRRFYHLRESSTMSADVIR